MNSTQYFNSLQYSLIYSFNTSVKDTDQMTLILLHLSLGRCTNSTLRRVNYNSFYLPSG
uniref:Uncharacterized protein n=1 Tax=Anguilla anguilla TaxID=7936 RepID=A0A0E9XGC8_ANGAN